MSLPPGSLFSVPPLAPQNQQQAYSQGGNPPPPLFTTFQQPTPQGAPSPYSGGLSESVWNQFNDMRTRPGQPVSETKYADNEQPPLLEDLGIDVGVIRRKFIWSLQGLWRAPPTDIAESPEMTLTLLLCTVFSALQLPRTGQFPFPFLLCWTLVGAFLLRLLVLYLPSLSAETEAIPFYTVGSALGYGMWPLLAGAILALAAPRFAKSALGLLVHVPLTLFCAFIAVRCVEANRHGRVSVALLFPPILAFYAVLICSLVL